MESLAHRSAPGHVDDFLSKHGFDYVGDVDANLDCPICRSPFVRPVMSPECGHVFCLSCLETHNKASGICPIDRQPLDFGDLRPAPRVMHAMVDELLVRCPHYNQGCIFQSQRHLLRAHLISECPFSEALCPCSKDCDRVVLKRDLPAHVEVCQFALVPCPMTCGAHVRRADLDAHAESVCPKKQVECAYRCGRSCLLRAEIADHYALHCPKAPVDCPHKRFGCTWRGTRATLQDEHLLADCAYDGIKGYLESAEANFRQSQIENEQVRAKLARLEERQDRSMADIAAIRASLGDFAPPPARPRQRLPPASSDIPESGTASDSPTLDAHPMPVSRALEETIEGVKSSLASLQKSVDNLDLRQETTFMHETMRLQDEVQGLRAAVHGVRLQTSWLIMELERLSVANDAQAGEPGPNAGADWRARMMSAMSGVSPAALFGVGPSPTVLPPMPPLGFPRRQPSDRADVKL